MPASTKPLAQSTPYTRRLLGENEMQTLDSSEDGDLELMFAEIRRYPLLTGEQEKDIDCRKWTAVRALSSTFAVVPDLRLMFAEILHNALEHPPEVKRFPSREQHFTLRRELAAYFADGALADEARASVKVLRRRASKIRHEQAVETLNVPASLTVGIAVFMLRRAGGQFPDAVCDAIGHWSRHWKVPPAGIALEREHLKALRTSLRSYTEARDALVMHNLRLVHSIAGRYRGRGVGYLDLVQEGTLGLIRAAEKFEFEKGYRFSTYCFNWITQAVRRYVGDTGNLIRLPTHVQDQVNKVYRERAIEQAKTGMEPDAGQLAQKLGMDKQKTKEILEVRNLAISLDAPRYDDDESTLVDTLTSDQFGDTTTNAELDSLHRFLGEAVDQLEANEQAVVVARWGLHDGPPLSRSEIADRLGVSREWVRQLERSALKKLKGQDGIQQAFVDYQQVGASA
jgi:RNA polymerase sigma factor (sigma-70 family)